MLTQLSDYIVYLWILPLVFFIIIPLIMFGGNTVARFVYFMFNPKRSGVKRLDEEITEEQLEKSVS